MKYREIFPGLIFFRSKRDEEGNEITVSSETLGFDLPEMEIWTCRAVKIAPPSEGLTLPSSEYFLVGPSHTEGGMAIKMTREEIGKIIYLGVDFACMETSFKLGPISEQINTLLEQARKDIDEILSDHNLPSGDDVISSVRR